MVVEPDCGIQVNNKDGGDGYIKLFGPYDTYQHCNWNIDTSCDKIQYVIDEIDIEYNSDCVYDS